MAKKPTELSEEEVFANDIDPLDALREIRAAEGVAEEDLPDRDKAPVGSIDPDELEGEPDATDPGSDEDDKDPTPEDPQPEPVSEEPDGSSEAEGTAEQERDEGESEETPEPSETEKAVKEPEKLKFRANGQDFEFTEQEVMEQFQTVFGQAMNFTQKMQAIAPYRKMISALEQEGITQDQLNLALDALKGNQDALSQLMTMNKIDPYDFTNRDEPTNPYTPTDYGKNETQLSIEEVTSKIAKDDEYPITANIIGEQWDDTSRQMMASNPGMIEGLHNDVRNGLYDKVAPVAMKMKVLDGNTKSDIEYYMLAGQKIAQEQQQSSSETEVARMNQKTQDAETQFDKASSEAQQKRAATSTRARADRKGVIDYLDDDDEKFDQWYNNLVSSN